MLRNMWVGFTERKTLTCVSKMGNYDIKYANFYKSCKRSMPWQHVKSFIEAHSKQFFGLQKHTHLNK